jgi:hypothetical protein
MLKTYGSATLVEEWRNKLLLIAPSFDWAPSPLVPTGSCMHKEERLRDV